MAMPIQKCHHQPGSTPGAAPAPSLKPDPSIQTFNIHAIIFPQIKVKPTKIGHFAMMNSLLKILPTSQDRILLETAKQPVCMWKILTGFCFILKNGKILVVPSKAKCLYFV